MNNKTVKFGIGREKPADQKNQQLELFTGDFSKPRWAKAGENYGGSIRALQEIFPAPTVAGVERIRQLHRSSIGGQITGGGVTYLQVLATSFAHGDFAP